MNIFFFFSLYSPSLTISYFFSTHTHKKKKKLSISYMFIGFFIYKYFRLFSYFIYLKKFDK